MTSTGHTPIDHTDRWASARREQGEEKGIGKIEATNRATDQVLPTPDRSEALIRCLTTGKDPGLMMPRAGRDSRLHSVGTSVYLYYDDHDTLIYVGITDRGMTRNYEHNLRAEWWPFVARQEVEHYSGRGQAEAREKLLIATWNPPFNRLHNPNHQALKAAYLQWREDNHAGRDPRELVNQLRRQLPLRPVPFRDEQRLVLLSDPEFSAVTSRIDDAIGTPVVTGRPIGRVVAAKVGGAFTCLQVEITKKSVARTIEIGFAIAYLKYASQNPIRFRISHIEVGRITAGGAR